MDSRPDQKQQRQSLITQERSSTSPPLKKKLRLDILLVFAAIGIILLFVIIAIVRQTQGDSPVKPVRVAIPWSGNGSALTMQVGTSRVFEPLLYSGNDNRALNNFKQVQERETTWSVDPAGVITVDMYGRVNAVKQGSCKLRLQSKANSDAFDELEVKVVSKRTDIDNVPKRVIKFNGSAVDTVSNLQKVVERFTVQQIIDSADAPESVKYAAQHPTQTYPDTVTDERLTWSRVGYADGSSNEYVKLVNNSKLETDRDRVHCFIGDRYLPDAGTSVVMIETDKKGGVWIVSASGNTTHVKMQEMSYSEKADLMNKQTQKYVLRLGLASGAQWNGQQWVQEVSDNDGLWTSMYGAGELMKYAVLKQRKAVPAVVAKARQSALGSLKAVLLAANVAGREGKVQAKIRFLNNSRLKEGRHFSKQYLLQGKQNIRDTYVGSPIDGIGLYGNVAGKNISGDYFTGIFKYSMLPMNMQDWSTNGTAATTERSLDGYISRTFVIPASGLPQVPKSGLFFQRNDNKQHTVLSGASQLFDFKDTDHPNIQLGNKPIPEVLKSVLNINGKQYKESDIVYKGDTSTDQVIGHLFIYKIAFDILDESDIQQKQLKQLISQTMNNFCQHLVNNGYAMVDATGLSTTWTKLFKQFLVTDYTLEDAPLKALQLLLSFKVGYYVTGNRKWKEQYDMLAKDEKFMYGKFVGLLWQKWVWLYTRSDDRSSGLLKLDYAMNPSQVEIERHVLYQTHFSDEEEAYLAFYLAFQLQDDKQLLEHFRKDMNGYWHSVSKSQNPLWYFIHQLAYPDTPLNDSFGQDLRSVASWQLSRHMIDTTEYQANIKGARNDVIYQGPISVDPRKVIGRRTSESDRKFVDDPQNSKVFPSFDPTSIYEVKVLPADERSIHKFNGATFQNIYNSHNPNGMQPSTTYSLPYWLGVYHGLIKFD